MRDNIIAGLDIGSSAIRLVVGQYLSNANGENNLQIVGAVEAPSDGISKGVVTSIEDTTSAISSCLEKAERLIGVPIESVWASINGPQIRCVKSRGVVAVGKSDGEITEEDLGRVIDAAQAMSVPPNYEILHVIPIKYTVDNQEDVRDPIGMTGIRLEAEVLIIQGLSSHIKNLTKAIYRTKLEIEELVLSPLVAADAVISSKQKELGAALINIGSSTTSLAVFEEGELLHTAVLPIGSEHITADVAIGLRCPINLAERIKIEYGNANAEQFNKKDEVDISNLIEEEGVEGMPNQVSLKYISEIIEARVEEIFEKVDDEFKKIERSGMLPAGVFLIGGGAKTGGIVEAAKRKLRLPVCLGANKTVNTVIDKVNDPSFLTALGLVVWGGDKGGKELGFGRKILDNSFFKNITGKAKSLFSSLIPD